MFIEINWSSDITIKYLTLMISAMGVIAALTGAFITIRKFFYERNREIYIRRLDEVYAPLYGLLLKQKKYLELFHPDQKVPNDRLITLVSAIARKSAAKQRMSGNKTNVPEEKLLKIENMDYGLDAEDFLIILKNANKGLMRPSLLKIYYELDIAYYLNKGKDDPMPDIYREKNKEIIEKREKQVAEGKEQLEKDLIHEIEKGYFETLKKLGIDNINKI